MPAYEEADFASEIADFYHEVCEALPELAIELVVIDDGSQDGTASALSNAFDARDAVKIVRFSRNFGSHAAISAGFAYASGDAAITLSADRQEPLSAVAEMVAEWRAGADIVWGLRSIRATSKGLSDSFATNFSKIYQATSDVPSLPKEGPSIVLVSRAALDVFNKMPELNRNVMAMLAWVGFDQRSVYFEQIPRPHGVSKWTLRRKLKLVVDSFVEFSHAPLQWLTAVGIVFGLLGLLALLTALVLLFTPANGGAGVALIAGLVLAVGGVNLGAISVLGEYVWRAGDDSRRRPVYIVRSVEDRTTDESQD
ncbi:glycosyltransferase family 2 protein [Humibacter antri]